MNICEHTPSLSTLTVVQVRRHAALDALVQDDDATVRVTCGWCGEEGFGTVKAGDFSWADHPRRPGE